MHRSGVWLSQTGLLRRAAAPAPPNGPSAYATSAAASILNAEAAATSSTAPEEIAARLGIDAYAGDPIIAMRSHEAVTALAAGRRTAARARLMQWMLARAAPRPGHTIGSGRHSRPAIVGTVLAGVDGFPDKAGPALGTAELLAPSGSSDESEPLGQVASEVAITEMPGPPVSPAIGSADLQQSAPDTGK